jgi:PAS domain S-box-containing protein
MKPEPANATVRPVLWIARLAGSLALMAGTAALAGWALDIDGLKSLRPGWVTVKPNTAIGLALTGIATLLASGSRSAGGAAGRVGRSCGLLAGGLGIFSLVEYAFNWAPGFDQWLFPDPADAVGTSHLGRMAPEAALCFALMGAALWIVHNGRPARGGLVVSAVAGLLVTTLALASLLCYFTPSLGAFGWWGLTIMAVPTAVTFVALGVAVMSATWQPGRSFWALGKGATGAIACSLTIVMLIGLNTSRTQARLRSTAFAVAQGEQLAGTLAELLAEVSQAQNHARGFVITGEERYQQSLLTAIAQGRATLDRLLKPGAGRPAAPAELAGLAAPTREALDWYAQAAFTGPADVSGATRRQMTGHGEDQMAKLRALFERALTGVREAVAEAKREADAASTLASAITTTGTLLSLGIFFAALFGLNRTEARRQRAEADLHAAHDRLRRFVDANIVGLVITDATGAVIEANDYYLRLIGYTREELQHLAVDGRTLAPPEGRPADTAARHDSRTRTVCAPYEQEIIRRDGTRVAVLQADTILPGPEPQIAAFVIDVTERKQAEQKIRQLNAELEQRVADRTAALEATNRELEAFAYSVSHDLRAPLRSIDGFSRILLEDYAGRLDDEGRDSLQRVRAAAQRMGQLIDDLLKLSRVTRVEILREPVDLSALAESVAADLRQAEPHRAATITIARGLGTDGDPHLLRVVLENLLGNAWKFTSRVAHAQIEVGAATADGQTRFFVRDNGAGFDPAYAAKLFGAFQRLHTAGEFPGTGIGLATVQRIIHRHGGRVWAEGGVDKGAVFYFTVSGPASSPPIP